MTTHTETIDALVAERVMGWTRRPDGGQRGWVRFPGDVAYFETADWSPMENIADAWSILGKLERQGIHVGNLYRLHETAWVCMLHNRALDKNDEWTGIGNTAMSAICRAALGTVGVTDEYTRIAVWDNDKKEYRP